MYGRATSYTGVGGCRQSPGRLRLILILVAAAAVGGCSSLGEKGTGRLASARPAPASAEAVLAQVDASDWETIRREVAGASEATGHTLSWRNPDTGSNGSIAVLPAFTRAGSLCRSFAATVNDVRGVHRYGGDACLRTDGRWQLHGITADDVLVS